MKVVYNWLKEFVDLKSSADQLRGRLSLTGTAVDAMDETPAGPILDVEVTANRPDCLGHYGIAREAAAIYRMPLKSIQPSFNESTEKAADLVRVEIAAPDLCGRFTARVVRGLKVQASPDWLRKRLEAIGQKTINNVVDVSNYVMFELGHPSHAFDLDKIAERRVIVRRAENGEKLRTLDGVDRALTNEMCVIADPSRALSIAGVMGGAESEISSSTRNALIECAWFHPISIRRTSKALGMRSEAAYRFERGADPEMAEVASRRAAELIQKLAGGEIASGVVDAYPRRPVPLKIELSRKELLRVMGADIPDRDIEEILASLGFHPVRVDSNRGSAGSLMAVWQCVQPSWRQDVTRAIDLIEEVARHYGYDRFPPRLPPAKRPAKRLPHATAQDRLIERIVGLGYQEIVEIPLVDPGRDETFRAAGVLPAKIANPLAEDASIMRSAGATSMLAALEWNLNHGQRNLRLFEIGACYELRNGAPFERLVLTVGATGLAREKSIYDEPRDFTFADFKGDLDRIGELAGGFSWEHGGPDWLAQGRAARISLAFNSADSAAGVAGQLAQQVADRFKIRQRVFLAELRLEPLLAAIEGAQAARHFTPLARFPAVERDFSLLLRDEITFAEVVNEIHALSIAEIGKIRAGDRMTHEEAARLARERRTPGLAEIVPPGKYSLMLRITFQSMQATLTETQLTDFSARIVAALQKNLDASLRVF